MMFRAPAGALYEIINFSIPVKAGIQKRLRIQDPAFNEMMLKILSDYLRMHHIFTASLWLCFRTLIHQVKNGLK
jgi:hypothetical protein